MTTSNPTFRPYPEGSYCPALAARKKDCLYCTDPARNVVRDSSGITTVEARCCSDPRCMALAEDFVRAMIRAIHG